MQKLCETFNWKQLRWRHFGARYDGWSNNTIVNDCYSPSFGNRDYNKTGNPIYSNGIVRGSQNPTFMSAENRKKQFLLMME